ncbi:MAG TPA: hypothetical protein VK558_17295 [Patescibacteria group bacterium]|nr:hypothetical protein [Patescibacteria group bacterium]
MPSHARNSPIVEFPAAYTMSCGMVQREGTASAMPAAQYGKKRARGKALPAAFPPWTLGQDHTIRMDNIRAPLGDINVKIILFCNAQMARIHSTFVGALGGIQFSVNY